MTLASKDALYHAGRRDRNSSVRQSVRLANTAAEVRFPDFLNIVPRAAVDGDVFFFLHGCFNEFPVSGSKLQAPSAAKNPLPPRLRPANPF